MTTQASFSSVPKPAAPATRVVPLDTQLLSLEVRGDVAIITYDVPGEAMNTLRAETDAELELARVAIESDPAVRAAVFISGKPSGFIAGADIEMLRGADKAGLERLSREGQAGFARLAAMRKPIVAAISGPCLGGGFELALACHGRVASDDDKTVFGLPEVQLGLLPGADGLQRVAARAGLATALELGLTGKQLRPAKAKRLGLVDEIVAKPILLQAAIELARTLADEGGARPPTAPRGAKGLQRLALEKNPLGRALVFKKAREATRKKTHGHYPAAERIIDVLEAYAGRGLDASRDVEARSFAELGTSATSARLGEIFFATTALKKDSGVDDPSVRARPVDKVAVLGAGLMGAGIAYVSASAGLQVRLKDRDDASVDRGLKYVADIFAERVKRKALTRLERDKRSSLVSGATDYAGVGNAGVVIEAVFEDLALKHRVLAEVEAATGAETIFASNTSSIPITRIAAASKRPEMVVGMHYFSPVHKMPLLEVIRAERTAPWVVATAVALGKRQGKTVIVVNDGVGFYTSRVLGPYMNEAAFLLDEGVPIGEIDRALVEWGWPVGPMALIDEVGIDVAAHVGQIMREAFGERLAPPPTVSRMMADGRKGRKNGRGLYLYNDENSPPRARFALSRKPKGKVVDEAVYGLLGIEPKPGKVAPEELVMRCTLQLVNEAFHCLGEGILRSPRDGDIGAIFGLGFPPFRGGPFRFVDSTGPAEILKRIRAYYDRLGERWTPAPALVTLATQGARTYGLRARRQCTYSNRRVRSDKPSALLTRKKIAPWHPSRDTGPYSRESSGYARSSLTI